MNAYLQMNMKLVVADRRKKAKYVCGRIPDEGMRIVLVEGTSEYPPIYAELSLVRWEGRCDLVIETNEPDFVDLNEVYRYFRHRDMTLEERWREMVFVDPAKDYRRKVALLSQKERELFEASSETQRHPGRIISASSYPEHDYNGQTKACLSLLVKMGLLHSNSRGYIRRRPPSGPYYAR
jgi:hypothetical protein